MEMELSDKLSTTIGFFHGNSGDTRLAYLSGITICAGLIDLRRATRKFHLPELDEAESNRNTVKMH
uniref:Uncharacterized protein n=1 Tax=Oryza nivara TaxID=4536 RepID=A0A0E0HTE4_ORYNI